jgi:tight adherence protein C
VLLLAIAGLLVGFFAPDLYLYQRAEKRADQIRRSLADAVDLLTISVEAGLGFDAAVQQVARNTEGPLAEEFSRVLREMQLGMGRSEAMRSMGERSSVEELHTFVGSMVQADAFGIPISQVLRVQSSEIRTKRRQYAEEKAQQVPVKIMIPLILCILPCLFVVVMGPPILNAIDNFHSVR